MPRHEFATRLLLSGMLMALFVFYVGARPLCIHVSDSYAWTNTVSTQSFAYFFHPHHVLYIPLAWRWDTLVRWLLPGVSTWASLSALSAAFGCFGVAAVFRTIRLLGARREVAVAGATLPAFAFGWWFFASEPEVYVISASCALWSFYFMAAFQSSRLSRCAAWAGVAAGFAALFHQTGIFLFVPAVIVFFSRESRASFAKAAFAFTLAFALVVSPVYLAACWAVHGSIAPAVFVNWIFLFGSEGYGGLSASSPVKAALGLARALVGGQALLDSLRGVRPFGLLLWTGLVLALTAFVSLAALLHRALAALKTLHAPARRIVFAAVAAFMAYGAFGLYFDPANFEWWTIPVAFGVLAVGIASLVNDKPAVKLVLAASLLLGLANFVLDFSHRRDPSNDIVRNAALTIAAMSTPQDVIVVPSFLGSLIWYENRDRNIFCPDKFVRSAGHRGLEAKLAELARLASSSGGHVLIAGFTGEGASDHWLSELLLRVSPEGIHPRGQIRFFEHGPAIVRAAVPLPVISVDAPALIDGLKAASLASSGGAS